MALVAISIATAPTVRATEPSPLAALVDAAAARLQTADPVAAFKWRTDGNIEDPGRVKQVLAAVTADARLSGVDPDYVERVFTDQIDATEAIEYRRFSEWKLNPDAAPATAPDLSASRSQIDALNHAMVVQITSNWSLLHSPECAAERDDALAAVADGRQLDSGYRQALAFATHSYCERVAQPNSGSARFRANASIPY